MKARMRRLRRYFLVGLVVIAPVGLTVFVLAWVFNLLDSILGDPLQDLLRVRIPGLGFVLLAAFVLLVGWVVHQAVGRQLLHWWNQALVRFPLTGRIYSTVSQIVQGILGEQRRVFRRTVLIPYPTDGLWAVAFVTSEEVGAISSVVGEPCVNVFVPTTPNPTSGFMLIVPRARLRELPISTEEAMKLIISAGAVVPKGEPVVLRRGLDLDTLFGGEG
ncbi:MAG: hypothetical protein KatS3mg081_0223 [Gemmatimonadales bacterium]|nr:hypothetical protein HRbin33_02124 [bacterium HR33]GIW50868.1 MAG: hypothetical protein KatS3mg081_0223 [Gemmatimonadales bacterium]